MKSETKGEMKSELATLLKYVKNITIKLINIDTKLTELETRMVTLGVANSNAFGMCKETIVALARNQESVYDELMDASGKLQACSWAD
jgi:hypothetical protein